jgi:hypothetical protein
VSSERSEESGAEGRKKALQRGLHPRIHRCTLNSLPDSSGTHFIATQKVTLPVLFAQGTKELVLEEFFRASNFFFGKKSFFERFYFNKPWILSRLNSGLLSFNYSKIAKIRKNRVFNP